MDAISACMNRGVQQERVVHKDIQKRVQMFVEYVIIYPLMGALLWVLAKINSVVCAFLGYCAMALMNKPFCVHINHVDTIPVEEHMDCKCCEKPAGCTARQLRGSGGSRVGHSEYAPGMTAMLCTPCCISHVVYHMLCTHNRKSMPLVSRRMCALMQHVACVANSSRCSSVKACAAPFPLHGHASRFVEGIVAHTFDFPPTPLTHAQNRRVCCPRQNCGNLPFKTSLWSTGT